MWVNRDGSPVRTRDTVDNGTVRSPVEGGASVPPSRCFAARRRPTPHLPREIRHGAL